MKRSEKINIISGLYCFAALILYTLDLGGNDLHLYALVIPIISLTPFILIRNEKFQNECFIYEISFIPFHIVIKKTFEIILFFSNFNFF